jgi:hypothetical protein
MVRRLSVMAPAEVVSRVRQAMRVQADLLRGSLPRRRQALPTLDGSIGPAILSPNRADAVRSTLGDRVALTVGAAEAFVSGEFSFLGYPAIQLTRPLSYDTDPFSRDVWPRRHGLLLDYRTATVGDPKWIWELNRLQHLPLLFAASLLTDEPRFAEVAVEDLESWLVQARHGYGIAWSNAYEPGLRAISLALSLDALRGLDVGDARLGAALLDSLREHVHWIRRYPSLFSSANNHRIGELTAILVTAALAPELRLGDAATAALDELRQRCDQQFATDGSHREQSFGYAVFSLELLLVAAGALRSTGAVVPGWLDDVFRRAADALAAQLGEDDPDPRYGDRDDGGATLLGGRTVRSGRHVLSSLRHALGERDAETARDLDPSSLWLFGGCAQALSRRRGAGPESRWLKDAGLVLLRAGRSSVAFDVGPMGFGRLAAHGHADALHVTVARGGTLLVGDPGTGSYFRNAAAHRAFRSTGFHATVVVDGVDQADAEGPFLWGRPPMVAVSAVDLGRRTATASHDGYRRLGDPVTHTRTVLLIEDGLLLIRDILSASLAHRYSQRWPLPAGAGVEARAEGAFTVTAGDAALLLQSVCSAPCAATVTTGGFEPFEGWWSNALESIEPAPLVRYDAFTVGGVEFVTLLAFGMQAEAELEVGWDERVSVVRNGSERVIPFEVDVTPVGGRR